MIYTATNYHNCVIIYCLYNEFNNGYFTLNHIHLIQFKLGFDKILCDLILYF